MSSKTRFWAVLKAAHSMEGYLEKASNSNIDRKKGNAGDNNWTRFPRDIYNAAKKQGKTSLCNEIDYAAPWCDCFADWCIWQGTDGKGIADASYALCGRFDDYTVQSLDMYKKAGRFGKSPKLGAQIFFGSNGSPTHTGLVYGYSAGTVYTIEGNTSSASGEVANGGAVRAKSYSVKYERIIGYGYPRYMADAPTLGKYKALKARNVRSSAKATSKKVSTIAKGETFTITQLMVNSGGNTWGYVPAKGGWVCIRVTKNKKATKE